MLILMRLSMSLWVTMRPLQTVNKMMIEGKHIIIGWMKLLDVKGGGLSLKLILATRLSNHEQKRKIHPFRLGLKKKKLISKSVKCMWRQKVDRSVSYLDHLVEIQKSHRVAAYDLSEGLEHLKKRSLPLQSLFSNSSECSFSHNQDIVSKCMWRQKQLFDAICNTLSDECLLLTSVENNHLNNCQSVGAAASKIRLFLEEFVPDFKKSKNVGLVNDDNDAFDNNQDNSDHFSDAR